VVILRASGSRAFRAAALIASVAGVDLAAVIDSVVAAVVDLAAAVIALVVVGVALADSVAAVAGLGAGDEN
jgi:hypothetical protein